MPLLMDSFWRAVLYCSFPRVIFLSLLPLALTLATTLGLGYFFWDAALVQVQAWLESWALLQSLWQWLESLGAGRLKTVLVPLLIIFGVTPLIVMLSMLLVSLLMTPALVRLVAQRRFAGLQQKEGASWLLSLGWSVGSLLLAMLALVLSFPLWALPPLVLLLPPLIWGWLTYRVMAFDALAEHASADERRAVLQRHRLPLLFMGIVSGFLGAAPSLVWASGALFAAAFVLLVPLAVWIYMLVFAFASLWFTHYCLNALEQLRQEDTERTARAAATTAAQAQAQARQAAADVVDVPTHPLLPPPGGRTSEPREPTT